jgi:Cation/multidrug efflux pump
MKNANWLRWPLEHYSISLLIVGILFVLGIYGMYIMPKDEFPHATIRQGVVVAVYPGATARRWKNRWPVRWSATSSPLAR